MRRWWLGWPAWLWVTVVGLGAVIGVQRADGWIDGRITGNWLGGDLRREWNAQQQFGQAASIVIVCILIWSLDPARRTRLIDYFKALLSVGVLVTALKCLVGRPRPKFGDPEHFLGPLGMYPIESAKGTGMFTLQHAWDAAAWKHGQLWSMPSSHTAFAVTLCVFLCIVYPKLKWLAIALTLIVASGRLVFDAHYASDVVAGALVGGVVSWCVIGRGK